MEALAIGLAVYGAAVTFAWGWAWLENHALRHDLDAVIQAASDEATENLSLREQIAAFDSAGNGKIGGSKPRGKG
jgi:hypothetical protein